MSSIAFKSALVLSLAALGACSSSSTKTGDGAGSAGGSGGSSDGSGGAPSSQTPLTLPFFVNSPGNFVKSGFMGDAVPATGAATGSVAAAPSADNSDGTCAGSRASATAGGDCDTFAITPATGAAGWQGVFYQFPAANWGMLPGRTIAAGATTVTFSARASRSVPVKFQVGECDAANATDPTKCVDGFFAFPSDAETADAVSVGTDWAEHSISLAGVDYSHGVRGAFSWVIEDMGLGTDTGPLSLYIDNITWQ